MTGTASLSRRLKALGPALVLAAVVVGPGSIALSTIAGGTYGYRLLWIPVAATVFMITYTWMAARIGVVTGDTLFQVARTKYGKRTSQLAGVLGFCTIVAFQAGNNAGIGFASPRSSAVNLASGRPSLRSLRRDSFGSPTCTKRSRRS
ncbi:divalent metal cation transporter [Haladaptatus sp. R4]|uniref:divalent metal cation transporter n=1 Tax=Haladaptatus sp. R4 TaxID=1679489 RepID=UPI000ACDDE60|nr:divalent metal cation transporter [Haladaptatus sp. R4]